MALSIYERLALLISLDLMLERAFFLVLIPYLNFVFNCLQSASIIDRIEQQVKQAILESLAAQPQGC
ncbi:MAG: hypothetical protein ACUVRV_04035 [Cyanobacteriota bacterium]